MSFSPITHLRHVDSRCRTTTSRSHFYKDHWGLTEVGHDSGITYFAAEGSPEQYIIRVRRPADKRLDLVSFGAADHETSTSSAQRLASEGIRLVTEPVTLQTPGGGYGFRFFDIDGRTVEVSADVDGACPPQDRGEGRHPRAAVPCRPQLAEAGEDAGVL